MDLAKLKANDKSNDGVWCPIMFVDGTKTDASMKLAGTDSKVYRDKQREITSNRITEMSKGGGRAKVSTEEIEESAVELLSACILDWEGFESKGAEYPLTHENAKALLMENAWIKEQVDAFVGDRRNFLSL